MLVTQEQATGWGVFFKDTRRLATSEEGGIYMTIHRPYAERFRDELADHGCPTGKVVPVSVFVIAVSSMKELKREGLDQWD